MTTADTSWTWARSRRGTLVALNVLQALIASYLFQRSKKTGGSLEDAGYYRHLSTMDLIYVCVALRRSLFAYSSLRQLVCSDFLMNSSLLIRGFAIFTELSFAGLIAKKPAAHEWGSPVLPWVSRTGNRVSAEKDTGHDLRVRGDGKTVRCHRIKEVAPCGQKPVLHLRHDPRNCE